MKRREFITLLGGAVAWPRAARAQQAGPMRRVGVLMGVSESDHNGQSRLSAFVEGLAQSGWTNGQNVRIDIRWSSGDPNGLRALAADLVRLQPDVMLVAGHHPPQTALRTQPGSRRAAVGTINSARP